MYFITTVSEDDTRCVGYVSKLEDAINIVEHNMCDIWEAGCYPYAVIENIKEGLYQYDLSPLWFKYDETTDQYVKTKTPPSYIGEGLVGFSIG